MRWVALILTVGLVGAAPAVAEDARLDWPLRPPPVVARGFDAPSPDWTSRLSKGTSCARPHLRC